MLKLCLQMCQKMMVARTIKRISCQVTMLADASIQITLLANASVMIFA